MDPATTVPRIARTPATTVHTAAMPRPPTAMSAPSTTTPATSVFPKAVPAHANDVGGICPTCGATQDAHCPTCGTVLPKHCPLCGAVQALAEPAAADGYPAASYAMGASRRAEPTASHHNCPVLHQVNTAVPSPSLAPRLSSPLRNHPVDSSDLYYDEALNFLANRISGRRRPPHWVQQAFAGR